MFFTADGIGPPVLHPLFIPPDLGLGDSLDVFCSLKRGTLPVRFEWKINGKKAAEIQSTRINTSERRSVFVIANIRPEHIGNYTCEASNTEGFTHVETELKVEGESNVTDFNYNIFLTLFSINH